MTIKEHYFTIPKELIKQVDSLTSFFEMLENLERFLFGSFHIYDTRRDNDTLVYYNAVGILLKNSLIPDFSSYRSKYLLNLFVSNKSLVLNFSDCVKHCESKSMILPTVDDTKRIKEEFKFIFDGSGTISGWALIK